MPSRILSTLVLWGVTLSSLWYFGAHAAVALVTLMAALTLDEFYRMLGKMGFRPFRRMGLLFSVLLTAGPYYLVLFLEDTSGYANLTAGAWVLALAVLAMLACCIRVLGERDDTNRVESIAATMLGLLYIPLMLQFLVLILMFDADSGDNLTLCLWVVAVSKFCDVGALLIGLAFGRHKLAPQISPKKTWEGAVGGVLVSTGVGAAIAFFFSNRLPEILSPLVAAVIALPLAVIAIISDLIESALKRRADLKDTGQLIPGIGGAFDLTDSLILTAPIAYFIFLFLI